MARRGRPKGYLMSEESKAKTSDTRTGHTHSTKTKKRIGKGLKNFFKSEKGQEQIARTKEFMSGFWNSYDGIEFRENLSEIMKEYYDTNFRE